jgi:2-polyprenyl-3-methyl-5-hydroxy-6-metoxy-1,4-benzoquinol methylase
LNTFNQSQYEDFLVKSEDVYAKTKYEILLEWLSGRGRLKILNAGCGSGELSLLLASRGHEVVGIDPGEEYIQLARERAGDRVPNCKFVVSSIEDYRWASDFDAVISTDVLEHIEGDKNAFNCLANLVRPGGHILITVPAGQWLFGYHDEQLGHYRRYSATTARHMVSETCRVQRVRYFGTTLIPVCLLYSQWLRKPYPVAEVGGNKRSLVSRILNTLLTLEKRIHFPLGTSLLLCAERKRTSGQSTPALRRAA